MDNFFKMIKNIIPPKVDESKRKEEEDNFNTVFNFEISIEESKIYEHLDYFVKGLKVNNKDVESFEDFLSNVDELISEYDVDKTEFDYRYKQYCERNGIEYNPGIFLFNPSRTR